MNEYHDKALVRSVEAYRSSARPGTRTLAEAELPERHRSHTRWRHVPVSHTAIKRSVTDAVCANVAPRDLPSMCTTDTPDYRLIRLPAIPKSDASITEPSEEFGCAIAEILDESERTWPGRATATVRRI